MGTFRKYQIVDDVLYLTESMYWTFELNRPDAIRVWRLSGVEKTQLDKAKLDTLISYEEDADIEELDVDGKKRLVIDTYFDNAEYIFDCKEIHQEVRPHNKEELTEIILRQENTWRDQQTTIYKQKKFIDDLKTFIDKQIDKKSRVLEGLTDTSNHTYQKSKHQLDILTQIKSIIKTNSFE